MVSEVRLFSILRNESWIEVRDEERKACCSPAYLYAIGIVDDQYPGSIRDYADSHQESIGAFLRVPGALQVTLLVAVIYLALLVTLFCTRYQWAAVAEICEDRIVFWALFTHRTFYYSDMHHIGVDYGLLDGRKQFWMYFSKTPIPAMYYHRINRMKPSRSFMRVQYCKKTYERLVANTPPQISNQLRKCYSTIRLHDLDKKE